MRHLGLRLEHGAHQLREVGVDLDDLLELVEDERDRRFALRASRPGSSSSRSSVASRSAASEPGLEAEGDRAVVGVDGDRRE